MSAHLAVESGSGQGGPDVRGDGSGPSFELHVSVEGTTFVLAPEGCLDGEAGDILENAVRAAMSDALEVVVDLALLQSMTKGGASCLQRCVELGARVDDAVPAAPDGAPATSPK